MIIAVNFPIQAIGKKKPENIFDIFFLIDLIVRGEAASNRKHGYFILGILRADLWSQGRIAREKIHQNFPAAKCDIKLHSDAT